MALIPVLLSASALFAFPAGPPKSLQGVERPEEPQVMSRPAQHYVAIRTAVAMGDLGKVAPRLWPELFGWIKAHHGTPAGPPFIRYDVVDMPKRLDIEVGIPVAAAMRGSGRVQPGQMPAGRYVVLVHHGDYDGLVVANGALQTWAKARGVALEAHPAGAGLAYRARAEYYPTDPAREPDRSKWETVIVYLAAPESSRSGRPHNGTEARAVR